MRNRIISPFFFTENTITANIYLDMLMNFAVPQLEDLQPHVIFQQDGAPPHWGLCVRDFLNEQFPDRWIGRDGLIPWPPRLPDITPLDSFLWGYVLDIVYRTKVRNIDFKHTITEAIATVDAQIFDKTWAEIEYFSMCCVRLRVRTSSCTEVCK
jgi:hypothetical protein